MNVDINSILNIYDKEISKTTKNKRKIIQFEKNKMQTVEYLIDSIRDESYTIKHYNIFVISDPKFRVIMSLPIKDKIVNHYITRTVLEPKLTKYLDIRNIATRKNMGTDYGIRKIKEYLEHYKKYDKFYVLKMDIHKYFYSIDHDVLKNMLKGKVNDFEYNLLSRIIDSTGLEEINETIKKQKEYYYNVCTKRRTEVSSIPYYLDKKGLPIGNMTSQFLSIFYLYELDHYIVHTLKLKHYIRYMDDLIIFDSDKHKLEEAKEKISNILVNKYKLVVNEKKTTIVEGNVEFSFLGYTYKVVNKKTIIKVSKKTVDKVIKSIKKKKYEYSKGIISFESYFSAMSTYYYSFKYGNNRKIQRYIDEFG